MRRGAAAVRPAVSGLGRDVSEAARRLVRRPGWSLAVVATLALGVASVTVLYSAVRGILLHPLPYAAADDLALAWFRDLRNDVPLVEVSWADFDAIEEAVPGLAGLSLMTATNFRLNLTGEDAEGDEAPVQVEGAGVDTGFFAVLGVEAQLGRTFVAADGEAEDASPVLISDGLWRRRFAADTNLIGRTVYLDGDAATVAGVLPPDVDLPAAADVWLPFARATADSGYYGLRIFKLVLRRPAATAWPALGEELAAVSARLAAADAQRFDGLELVARPLPEVVLGDTGPALRLLAVASLLVLLLAAGNAAGLLLVRGAGREGELALRGALGAGRGRLLVRAAVDDLLAAGTGAAAGLGLAAVAVRALPAVLPPGVPFARHVELDGGVLAFGAAVAAAAGLLCAAVPALRVLGLDPLSALHRHSSRSSSTAAAGRLRRGLVVVQVALSLLLLAGAVVAVRGFAGLAVLEPGFAADGVLATRLSLVGSRHPELADRTAFFHRLLAGVEALPGVERAGLVLLRPLSDPIGWEYTFSVEGQDAAARERNPYANYLAVSGGYFDALRIPLVAGRGFDGRDAAADRHTVVISRGMAERYWPGEDAVGRRIRLGRLENDPPWSTVIGVVGDVRYRAWDDVRLDVYVPIERWSFGRMDLVVRLDPHETAAGRDALALAPAVQRVVRDLDPGLALGSVTTLDREVGHALAGPRFTALLMAVLGGVALVLTAVGIGGLMAAWVAARHRELGIRLALGADGRRLGRLVGSQAAALLAVGLAAGLLLAAAAGRVLRGALWEAAPLDAAAFVLAALLVAAAAALGTAAPVRRAAASDPLTVLRAE
jgi:predicted permease